MIENISSRTNISVVLLRNSQAIGTETTCQWHPDRQQATNIVPIRTQPWRQTATREPERRSRKDRLRDNVALEFAIANCPK